MTDQAQLHRPTNRCLQSTLPWMFVAVALFACSGASCPQFLQNYPSPHARVLQTNASLSDVISVVNTNTALVHSLYTNDATISVPMMPSLRATLALERPGRFRLRGETTLTGPEVDLGSNDERFWFWLRRGQPPAVFYCNHAEFQTSLARQIVPIEPEWLIEALGVTGFDLNAEHQGPYPVGRGRLRIVSPRETAVGRVTKVTVVDEARGWVLEQHLYDANGALLASAIASEHERDLATGAVLPRKVRIEAPLARFSLELNLGTLSTNQPRAAMHDLWNMPQFNGYSVINLADPSIASMLAPAPP